jgi:hypothetical protein
VVYGVGVAHVRLGEKVRRWERKNDKN